MLGAAALDTDRLVRVLGLRRRGVNAWLGTRKGPLAPEFLILGVEPEPWHAADSAAWLKVMGLVMAHERHMHGIRKDRFEKRIGSDAVIEKVGDPLFQ